MNLELVLSVEPNESGEKTVRRKMAVIGSLLAVGQVDSLQYAVGSMRRGLHLCCKSASTVVGVRM